MSPSLPMFAMGLFLFSEGCHADIDKYQPRFFWQGEANKKKKYHMAASLKTGGSRHHVQETHEYLPDDQMDLRIVSNDKGLWLDLIKAKYLQGQSFATCNRSQGSQFWQAIQSLKPFFRVGSRIDVGSGNSAIFWLDRWHGNRPLREQFSSLFAITAQPDISLALVMARGVGNLVSRRSLGLVES